jgi:hypothetical protein
VLKEVLPTSHNAGFLCQIDKEAFKNYKLVQPVLLTLTVPDTVIEYKMKEDYPQIIRESLG